MQNSGKKKNKSKGIKKIDGFHSSAAEKQDHLSLDCKPATEGRLVIRLPLKFKSCPEDSVPPVDSISSDSDDKPLSETVSVNRKAIKSGKKKKKNFIDELEVAKTDHVSNDGKISEEDVKKIKVKKSKTEKSVKNGKKIKREVENVSETVAVHSVRCQCLA